MKKRRIGKFYVSDELIKENSFAKLLAKMEFIPLRVEHLGYEGRFEYIGTSPLFNEHRDGMLLYEYDITVNDWSADLSVSVEKIS